MNHPELQLRRRSTNQGFVLIVALLLLLVLTLVGTVAMRSTTLDFRMVTNASLTQRNFEATEAARVIVNALLDGHTATRGGWPGFRDKDGEIISLANFGGNALAAFEGFFTIYPKSNLSSGSDLPDATSEYPYPPYSPLCSLVEQEENYEELRPKGCKEPDLRVYSYPASERAEPRQPDDVWTDVWITQVGNLNFGPLIAGRPPKLSYRIYHVRAVSHGAGNAQTELSWEFRALEADL